MPKHQVSDPITDQEMTFAHLVLSGIMTDRSAAEAAGLNPDTAAYTKAKPRVRDYMANHRAAVHEQLVQQEVEGRQQLNFGRREVLTRLWEIANMSPEMTRGSVTAQVKALTMIVAIEGLIPDRNTSRRAVSTEQESAPRRKPQIYQSAWLREQQGETASQPRPDLGVETEDPGVPNSSPKVAAEELPGITPNPASDPGNSAFVDHCTVLATAALAPRVPDAFDRGSFSIQKNRFGRRR